MKIRFLWRAFRARYRDQAAELTAIKSHVRPGDSVCDIGANKGSYVYWLSRWVRHGSVVAFEPQQQLAEYLRGICAHLPLPNVTVEAKAVHSCSGEMDLYIPGAGNLGKGGASPGASLSSRVSDREACGSVKVPIVTLDEYFPVGREISVLKIDVEGAESGVFDGARRILTEQSPLLVFECENRHLESGTVSDVLEKLASLGYEGRFVCGRALRPVTEFDPSVHQKQIQTRFWDAKNYYNNFIFRKKLNAS